ncbi:MAG: HEPN domain-containing protein [Chlorobi bacterium]|nr:HEPN domain-containing protein [Chlorobiota bacterium]
MNEITEQLKQWIEKSDHDLGTAIITHKYLPKYKDTIAFHCQQAVEKYLKAFILKLGLPIKRTHDLVYLLEQIDQREKVDKKWFEKVLDLQDLSVEIRYPDQVIDLSEEDIESAIKTAIQFREMILERLNMDIPFDDLKDIIGN